MQKKISVMIAAVVVSGAGVVALLVRSAPDSVPRGPLREAAAVRHMPSPTGPGTAPPSSAPPPPAPPAAVSDPLISWEPRLETILNAPGGPEEVAQALLEALPGLPVEAQERFTARALALSRTGDFSQAAAVYFKAGTPRSVALLIFDEALNRPKEIKLPFLAKTANQENHPLAAEARDLLQLFLEPEPGTISPGAWENTVWDHLGKPENAEPEPGESRPEQ